MLRPHALLARLAYWLLALCGPATRITIDFRRFPMLTTQKVLLTATPNGSISGPLQWSSSDPSVATVEANADGLTAFAIGRGPGSVSITATEPPRSDGTPSASGSISLSVSLPAATSIAISAGTPVPQ